jgi:hypothetical protein
MDSITLKDIDGYPFTLSLGAWLVPINMAEPFEWLMIGEVTDINPHTLTVKWRENSDPIWEHFSVYSLDDGFKHRPDYRFMKQQNHILLDDKEKLVWRLKHGV